MLIIKKISIIILSLLLFMNITACSKKEETIEVTEEVVEIIDEKIEDIDNYQEAITKLNFEDVDLEKEYTLEDTTVYLLKLFGKENLVLEANYQCHYEGIAEENKAYIAYAYANWLLVGVQEEDLIESNINTANNIAALTLRFMGYKDYGDNPDFVVEKEKTAEEKDETLSILFNTVCADTINAKDFAKTKGINFETKTGKFRGDYLVKALWDVLEAECSDGNTIKDVLEEVGVFTEKEYKESTYLSKGEEIPVEVVQPKVNNNRNNNVLPNNEVGNQDQYYDGGGSSSGGSSSGGGDTGGGDTGGGDVGGGDTGGGDAGGGGGESELPSVDF